MRDNWRPKQQRATAQKKKKNDDKDPSAEARTGLCLFHDIPTWQQENAFVLSGYRPTPRSTRECLLSAFGWHNESVNIVSHVLGSMLFACLPWHYYYHIHVRTRNTMPVDVALFALYCAGVSICFACSAACHTLWNHSPAVASFGNQLDYLGIILLMWTASLPSIYYGFICAPSLQLLHWSLTSLLAAACVTVTFHHKFSSPHYRAYRASLFIGLALSALLFVWHGVSIYGFEVQGRRMALKWMAFMASLNFTGAAAYATRIPEKYYPYAFDFVGASHQIFHVMVIFAGIAHYLGLIEALREVRQNPQECDV